MERDREQPFRIERRGLVVVERPPDVGPPELVVAGVASGLVNASRQIGGAVGIAAVSALATASTNSYLHSHAGTAASSAAALDHGLRTGLEVLTALLVAGAVIAVALVRPPVAVSVDTERREPQPIPLDEAA